MYGIVFLLNLFILHPRYIYYQFFGLDPFCRADGLLCQGLLQGHEHFLLGGGEVEKGFPLVIGSVLDRLYLILA